MKEVSQGEFQALSLQWVNYHCASGLVSYGCFQFLLHMQNVPKPLFLCSVCFSLTAQLHFGVEQKWELKDM